MASSPPASLSSHLDIPLTGFSSTVVRRSAQTLQNLLQTRFCCEAQVVGLDLDSDWDSPAARPHIVPEKRLESLLPSGVKVSVWRADLANFPAEAIVNAANSRLSHKGGLALALSEAGGPQVQQESDNYVYNHGSVKSGDAVALGPGKLKCKTIIHAVGPYLSYQYNSHQFSVAKNQLERAVLSVLKIVEGNQLNTVAIPAISSGIFNFPVDQCADIIVSTVQKFYGSPLPHSFKPKEVLLVNNDDHTVTKMERACVKLLPRPVLFNQATSAGNKPHTSAAMLYSTVASGTTPQTSASGAQTRGKGGTQPPEVQLGPVRVLLMKGCLEAQKMDVIVNTIGSNKQLNEGQVSKTLLKKAGSKMQHEISGAQLRGALYITQGYNLDCKEVYHICCPHKSVSGSDEVLFRAVQDSLWLAVSAQHRSIAFPAIGTGVLGFGDREAAQIMMNAVWTFAPKSPLPLDVYFVIFPSDTQRFKAFEAELNNFLRPKAFQMEPLQRSGEAAHSLNTNPALPSPNEQGRAATAEPCLRLQSDSKRSTAEAETWLRALLHKNFNTVCISNNFIQLLGESELEELSQTQVEGVQVEEILQRGRSQLIVSGDKKEDIVVTALKLELMLQKVQTQFLKEEVEELRKAAQSKLRMERNPGSRDDPQLKLFIKQLEICGLQIQKVETVGNSALEKVFKIQKGQMPSHSSECLLQLVSAQFCNLVSHIGFRPECAPPDDSSLGEGLYFAADVQTALRAWTGSTDQFLYLFVAEVLKGRSGRGKPGLVLAPGRDSGAGAEPTTRYDSVEGSGLTVIFNHHQALPRFIITCRRETDTSFL